MADDEMMITCVKVMFEEKRRWAISWR
jgi:hypothetical protein